MAPRVAPRPAMSGRALGLLALAGAAFVCAAAAPFAGERAEQVLHLLLFCFALAMVAVASLHSIRPAAEHMVGGSGYSAPRSRAERGLHATITLLYIVGLMVVVLAALVRFGFLDIAFSRPLQISFPIALAVYVTLLAIAAGRRIVQQGGVLRTWYTRAHGWFLAWMSSPILAVGAILVMRGDIESNGALVVGQADFLVLVLVGILGVGTQLLLAANLPTAMDLASNVLHLASAQRRKSYETPPLVYAFVLGLIATAIVGFLLVRFDVFGNLGQFQSRRVALILVLFPVAAALFFGVSALRVYRESKRGLYRKKLATKLRNDLMVYGLSMVGGLVAASLLAAHLLGRLDSIGPVSGQELDMDLIVLAVIATAGPIGIYMHQQNRRVDGMEARLADFLNDLAETRRAGLTLTASLQSCALSDYGPLTPEIRKMATQVGWGVPFTDALQQFADRVKTSLVRRSCSLIIEASRTGGSVAEILKAAAKDAYEIKALEQDRRVAMLTYLIVIYVVFFVFTMVLVVLDVQFIPKVIAASVASHETGLSTGADSFGAGARGINREEIHFAYFLGGVVQSVGNGLVGGILTEGRITGGLRHAAIMTAIVWVVFRFAMAG